MIDVRLQAPGKPGTRPVTSLALAHAERVAPLRSPTQAFAEGVRSRWSPGTALARPVDAAFARQALPLTTAQAHHWHLDISPRLNLRVASLERSVARVVERTREVPTERIAQMPPVTPVTVQRLLEREQRWHSLDREVAREVVAREGRAGDDARESLSAAASMAHAFSPLAVTRVFRRGAASTTDIARETARTANDATTASREPRATSTADRESPNARPPSPFDVDQLADRVVRVIDRRLTAQRERFGKI